MFDMVSLTKSSSETEQWNIYNDALERVILNPDNKLLPHTTQVMFSTQES